MKDTPDYAARFELVGELYYRRTGHMRPGKDSRTEDTGAHENRERFEHYVSAHLLSDLMDETLRLRRTLSVYEQ